MGDFQAKMVAKACAHLLGDVVEARAIQLFFAPKMIGYSRDIHPGRLRDIAD
jgi:hypothetical protein